MKERKRKEYSSIMNCLVWLFVGLFIQVTSVSKATAFTIGEEREVGEKLLYSVRSTFDLIDDPDITQYISRLGESVLAVAGVQFFDYHFFVIDDKEFNAFAAPSGLIFFHSGLIATMQTEDELVSVLAHEVGHIVKRHLASRIEKGKYTTIASLGLAIAALAFGGTTSPVLFSGALATGQSVSLHFSRQDEEEADLLAYGWMKELQRDSQGQVKMLESMRRIARYRSEKPPQYLLTHPNPEERLATIESLIDIDTGKSEKASKSTDSDLDKNFEFLRFKYRTLSKVKESQDLKNLLVSILSDSRASKFSQIMAQYGLSQIALNENDYAKSLALLDKVIEYFPDKKILRVDRGSIQFASAKFVEAENTLRAVLKQDRRNMYATFLLARLLYSTGRSEEAKIQFLTVRYELPEYSKVYFELGQIAADQNEAGLSDFYLGKYFLYEGKLKQARLNFSAALRSKSLPAKQQEEAKLLLKKIKDLLS